MSDSELKYGMVAKLETPLTSEEREQADDQLEESAPMLEINGEGTLLFYVMNSEATHDDYFGCFNLIPSAKNCYFKQVANSVNLAINEASIVPFVTTYYNGTDSPMTMLTVDEFYEKQFGDMR